MSAPTLQDLAGNALISALREEDRRRLMPHMMIHELRPGDVLQESGQEVFETWFPLDAALASFSVATNRDNDAVEVALVGREGAVGGIVSDGSIAAYATASVRMAGRFIRIRSQTLEQLKTESIHVRHWFSRYSDYLLAQSFQNAACNAKHTITQRTARWLVSAMDRTQSNRFELTQEQLAEMLGVGRTFVTRTVSAMRAEGLIESRRGVFTVVNEQALRNHSCSCGAALERHFHAVLDNLYQS